MLGVSARALPFVFALASLILLAAVPADPGGAAEARALVERAIQAHGGEGKLAKLTAGRRKMQGRIRVNGADVPVTLQRAHRLPDRTRSEAQLELDGQALTFVRVLNGDKAWQSFNGVADDGDEQLLAAKREEMHLLRVESLLPLLRDKAIALSPLGEIKLGERSALGVKAAAKGQRDVDLYFDKQTGLLVKAAHQGVTENGTVVFKEHTYAEHKEVDGLKRPTRIVIRHDGQITSEWEVTEETFPGQIEDQEFAKPKRESR